VVVVLKVRMGWKLRVRMRELVDCRDLNIEISESKEYDGTVVGYMTWSSEVVLVCRSWSGLREVWMTSV
jgi:hypothetical protein